MKLGYVSGKKGGAKRRGCKQSAEDFPHLAVDVGDEGDVHLAETSLLTVGVHPGHVHVLRVDARADDLGVELLELLHALGEGDDFRGAAEDEAQRESGVKIQGARHLHRKHLIVRTTRK